MALLDQLFRLRGAPRAGKSPVTLGALVAALPPVSMEQPASSIPQREAVSASIESSEKNADSAMSPTPSGAPIETGLVLGEVQQAEPAKLELPKFNESVRGPVRSGARFNPFAIHAEESPASREGNAPAPPGLPGLGPCLEDPSLPPLRLQAQVASERDDRPVILGATTPPGDEAPAGELRQIEAPAVRLVPLKTPARSIEGPALRADRPLMLRLEIQAEPSLDVVAFKQHAAKFPGVVKCVISDAHD